MAIDHTKEDLHDESYAFAYERKPLSRIKRLLEFINVRDLGVVADIGCGTGMLLEVLNNQWRAYHGVDLSPQMLERAKARQIRLNAKHVQWHREEVATFFARNPETFDTIFALDFSEHVDDKGWSAILRSAHSALKPGGTMYLHTPNRLYVVELLKDWGVLKQFPEHIAVRDVTQNINLLKIAGFSAFSIKYLSHYEHRQKPLWLFSYLPLIGQFFRARLFLIANK